MTISGNISVPSAIHEQLTISVSGTSALNYATSFASVLNSANSAGTLLISDLDTPLPAPGSANGETLEYTVLHAGETGMIGQGGAYLLDAAPGSTTVTGSGAGDTALAALTGGSGGMTYLDAGGNNNILFVSGDNTYIGSGESLDPGSDTITAGSGRDSITTGPGFATVFSGTGQADITLGDTGPGSGGSAQFDDIVVLNDGTNTVNAAGVSDLVAASAPGQVIYGGMNAADSDLVVIAAAVAGRPGADLLAANAANFTVSDSAGANTIIGGTGLLSVIANAAVTGTTLRDTVEAQGGAVDLFGAAGTFFTLLSTSSSQQDLFVAGQGNETLDGAGTSNDLLVFGGTAGDEELGTGAGLAQFVEGQAAAGTSVYDNLTVGTGKIDIFGGNGNDLSLSAPAANAGILYVAGADSETIGAAGASAPMTVFGGDGGSLVLQSGGGKLTFVGGTSFAETPSVTITAGAGGANIFGNDGDVATLVSNIANTSVFVASAGNETLDGAGFTGVLGAYGYNPADPIAGGNVNESITGGSGPNYFYTGAGYETFVAGPGTNAFQIDKTTDGLGGTITIYNYSSVDLISFNGYSSSEESAAIKSAAPASNGIVGTQITLSDQTTVLFVDATASDLTFKT